MVSGVMGKPKLLSLFIFLARTTKKCLSKGIFVIFDNGIFSISVPISAISLFSFVLLDDGRIYSMVIPGARLRGAGVYIFKGVYWGLLLRRPFKFRMQWKNYCYFLRPCCGWMETPTGPQIPPNSITNQWKLGLSHFSMTDEKLVPADP